MLRRLYIVMLAFALCAILWEGCCGGDVAMRAEASDAGRSDVEIISDADISAPLTPMRGGDLSRSVIKNGGCRHRANIKRFDNVSLLLRHEDGCAMVEFAQYLIRAKIRRGVVAERIFYSLCSLRI